MRRLCLLALTIVFFFGQAVVAQEGTTLSGTIEDQTGAVIPEAKLELLSKASGEVREATADGAGAFGFKDVPPGEYTLKAEAENFKETEVAITVGPKPQAPVRVKLEINLKEEMTIIDSRAEQPVTTGNNADAVDFDNDLLGVLPTEGQNIIPLVSTLLSPAAQGTEGISVVVDGVEDNRISVPTGAIRRVLINKNPYSAEYRRPGKARVEVVTRDGSRRRFEGSAAYFLRNSAFDARNAFAQEKPDLDRRLFEANLGGPVFGSKRATFFVSGERLKDDASAVVNALTPAGPFVRNVQTPERYTNLLGRIDLRPNELHRFTARYDFFDESERNRGVGGFRLPEQAFNVEERAHKFQVSHRAIFSATSLNDLRLVFEREEQHEGSRAENAAVVVIGAFTGGPAQVFQANRETRWEFLNTTTYLRGQHTFRFGAEVRPRFVDATDATNFGGTFEFSNLSEFANRSPFVFRINQGDPNVSFTHHEAYGFFQDELRLRQNFSLTLGLRYGWQSNLRDHHSFAPRLAFAFAPDKQKLVIRGGAGIFYERLPEAVLERSLLYDGARVREVVISEPLYPDPFGTGQQQQLPPPSVVRLAADATAPYMLQASLSAERTLWRRTHLTFEYLTLRGVHLFRSRNVNAPLPQTGLRPDADFLNVNQVESSASLRSNAFSTTFQGRIGKAFKGMAQYTLSRTTDDTDGLFALPADNFNLRPEWGRSNFDQRHRFTFTGALEMPRGWRASSILALASGVPFNITTGFDDNRDTAATDRPPGVTRNTGQGPGLAQLDVRLTKLFLFPSLFNRGEAKSERRSRNLEANIDAFNVLNRTNFNNFVGELSSPFFGRANSARSARTVQLSLKYNF